MKIAATNQAPSSTGSKAPETRIEIISARCLTRSGERWLTPTLTTVSLDWGLHKMFEAAHRDAIKPCHVGATTPTVCRGRYDRAHPDPCSRVLARIVAPVGNVAGCLVSPYGADPGPDLESRAAGHPLSH
jgi:hypothetical protein